MVRRRDIKKSDFTAVTESESSDYFDFVRNGQNLKISQADMATFLGATGTLEAVGEVTAIPVLRILAGVNYIRSILGGAGINVAVSAQDGIEISHNFTIDNTGVPIMIDSLSDNPTIRSLQAGAGINVSASGDVIQIAATAVPESTKTIFVYSISDFPEPVADLITLEADTEYKLQNDISSPYRYLFSSNSVISGSDNILVELEYTDTGTMFTAVDANVKIKDVAITAASGTMFDISSTTAQHQFRVFNARIDCDIAGTLDNLALVYFFDSSFTNIYTQGLSFTNSFSIALFDTMGATIAAGAGNLFTLGTATFDYFSITKGLFNINSTGYIISGLANSGNISSDGLGYITNSRNFGTTFPHTDNIFPTDDRWEYTHNASAPDSYDVLLATNSGTTISITGIGTPALVGAAWTTQKAYRFTGTAAGLWTYNGNQTNVEITAKIKAATTVATDTISFFLYKNGVQIAASRAYNSTTLNVPYDFTIIWDEYLENGDYIQLYAQNDDANVDILISSATIRIRS